MTDQDDSDERRTEGVRIIGAQEAAEAAGRPDVVRRRRRSEKKFGDRPDKPEATPDLPKIRISTTEDSGQTGTSFGAVPVVQPPSDSSASTHDSEDYGDYADRPKVGHARILSGEDSDDSEAVAADDQPLSDSGEGDHATYGGDNSDEETEAWDESPLFASELSSDDEDDWEIDEPDLEEPDDLLSGPDEDSFVMPHWTEPATGQVPRVVTGSDYDEEQVFTDQPRWHDEGERGGVTDFTDLVEDGPRLGALGDDDPDDEDPDYFDNGFFDDDYDSDDSEIDADSFDRDDDDIDAFARPPRRRERGDGGNDGDDSSGGDRDLVAATLVGLAFVGIGLFCFWLGGLATTVLVSAILLVASAELVAVLRSKKIKTPAALVLPAVAGLLFGTYFAGVDAYPVVLGLTVITTLLWYLWIRPGGHIVRSTGGVLLTVMWVGFLGSFATLMLGLGHEMQQLDPSLKSNRGIGIILAAVIVTVSHDVGAYFSGRYLGKTKLSEASPNKTYEGLAGGVLAGIFVPLVVVGFFHLEPVGESIAKTIIFSALCSMVAPLGDLCQSAIKRDLKVKDMGALLPGHGGVLDRFDAMLFVLPTAYYVSLLMGMWNI